MHLKPTQTHEAPLEDEELIEKIRQTDTRNLAFRVLVQKYQERLYRHIRRMVIDHDDADDLLQEVFVKTWKSLDKFRGDSGLYTWMYRIATNECLTHLRKKRRRFFLPIGDAEGELAQKLEQDVMVDGDEAAMALQKALLKLPDKQRMVFNMRYFEEMAYEQMAEITGTSAGALKASYHHAVKKVEAFIRDH